MPEEYRIIVTDKCDDADCTVIGLGLQHFKEQQAGADGHKHLCLLLHAPDGSVVGGLIGATFYDWFHISLLWIKEELRGQGQGHRLQTRAEQEAIRRGANGAFLDIFSFQAPGLYRKYGYEVFGQLDDFPERHTRFYFRKDLQEEAHSSRKPG